MNVIVNGGTITEEEKHAYVEYVKDKYADRVITELTIIIDGEFVNLKTKFEPDVPFNRIRRITGYLVGDMSRWNNGKRAEEKDRVKHDATK